MRQRNRMECSRTNGKESEHGNYQELVCSSCMWLIFVYKLLNPVPQPLFPLFTL